MARGLEIERKRNINVFAILFWLLLTGLLAATAWYGYRWYMEGETPPIVRAQTADPRVDETPVTPKQVDEHTVPATDPRYISIPSLGVANTRIFGVGVKDNKQLDAPKNISDAAWYTQSARPGNGYGAILINGHNGGNTRNGVFAKLGTLAVGADIILERGDGKKFTYTVVENQSMTLEEANQTGMAMMMKSADDTKEGLNLITCDGKWVPRYQQFDRRIMLRAVMKT